MGLLVTGLPVKIRRYPESLLSLIKFLVLAALGDLMVVLSSIASRALRHC